MSKNLAKNGKQINNYFSKSIFKGKPSDDEFDQLIIDSLKGLEKEALDIVNLDRTDCIKQTEMIIGPPDLKKLNGLEFKIKKGKDGFLRYVPLGITIYNFTDDSLVAYQCNFDPTTENSMNICTFEYFYNEIVSFETVTESGSITDFDWKDKMVKSLPIIKNLVSTGKIIQYDYTQKFKLTTTGGTSLSVTLAEDVMKGITDGGEFFLTKAQKSINVVRGTIRDKKRYTLLTPKI